MNREQMLVELEQYYEAAGFKDIYINKLKDMADEELLALYNNIFNNEEE